MAFKRLLRPGDHHRHLVVRSPEEYRQRHAAFVEKQRASGSEALAVVERADPVAARVEAGSWVADCDCNCPNSTSPEWGIACCFGCGDVRTNIVFPPDWEAIEALLVHRPQKDRRWWPDQTLDQVREHNIAKGWRVA